MPQEDEVEQQHTSFSSSSVQFSSKVAPTGVEIATPVASGAEDGSANPTEPENAAAAEPPGRELDEAEKASKVRC